MITGCLNCGRDYDSETQGAICPHELGGPNSIPPWKPSAAPQELAWLIACKNHDGSLIGWLGLWDNEDYGWTLDPNKAIRFARQKDADMMLSKWEVEGNCHLTSEEHMWL